MYSYYPSYPDGWGIFSFWIKQWACWTCSCCWWRAPKKEKSDIVVHHNNMNKSDCRSENLRVLCCDCHDFMHGRKFSVRRMKVVVNRREQVKRRMMGRYDNQGWPIIELAV